MRDVSPRKRSDVLDTHQPTHHRATPTRFCFLIQTRTRGVHGGFVSRSVSSSSSRAPRARLSHVPPQQSLLYRLRARPQGVRWRSLSDRGRATRSRNSTCLTMSPRSVPRWFAGFSRRIYLNRKDRGTSNKLILIERALSFLGRSPPAPFAVGRPFDVVDRPPGKGSNSEGSN